jgi:outer membrane protein OmpA-like peptidoglycan-associated protein
MEPCATPAARDRRCAARTACRILDDVTYDTRAGTPGGSAAGEAAPASKIGSSSLVQASESGGQGGAAKVGASTLTEKLDGSGMPLPAANRSAAESSLGVDLSSVRVHTGPDAQKAAAGMSAQAFTKGSDIFFAAGQYAPGSPAGDHLIAHELTHVAQQAGGAAAPQRRAQVTDVAEPAEVEAERGAAAIAAGQAFSVREQPTGIPRLVTAPEQISGNPGERGTAGGGTATTTHRAPTLGDTVGAPGAAAAAPTAAGPANVKVNASRARPLHFDGPSTPVPDRVFETGAATSPVPAGFTPVTETRGSVAAPMVEQTADPGIYIRDQPTPDDVQQGGIGDCYFQAALLGMAGRDPGRIKSMISADGAGGATITLWRRQDHRRSLRERIFGGGDTYDYTPVQVAVSDQLAVNISDGRIHGAQLRCAPQPNSVDYWADINGSALEVHRKDLYQCARWAPLMEKAYARFCQQYGQYGGAAPAGQGGSAAGTPGYDGINSGVANYALHVLYGAQADAAGATQYEWMTAFPSAGNNILAANPRAVDQLLQLAGRGETAAPGDATAPIITANTDPDLQINNLATAITNALTDPDYASLSADTRTRITALQTAVTAWQGLPPDPAGTAGAKATARTAVGNAAVEVARTPNHEHLAELRRHNPTPIQFEIGADAVKATDVPRLGFFGQWLEYVSVASLCPFVVNVVGHASNDGTDADNMALSERRATNTNAAVQTGRDAAKMARHTYNVSGVGEAGAGRTADWRRADITVEHGRPDNELFAGARSATMRAMMDLVLNVRNLGTDNSVGQRNVYAAHAYNVIGVNFVTAAGAPVPLQTIPSASRPAMFPQVDCDVSTIRVRNPHHGNEPDRTGQNQPTRPGDGTPSGPTSDGMFTMSVNEFFRNFNTLDSGVFPTTPNH